MLKYYESQRRPVIPEHTFLKYFFREHQLNLLEEHPIKTIFGLKVAFDGTLVDRLTQRLGHSISDEGWGFWLNLYLILDELDIETLSATLLEFISEYLPETRTQGQHGQDRSLKISNCLKMHYIKEKMYFDALNEALCTWRPFAPRNRPLPSQPFFERLNFLQINLFELDYIFSMTTNKLIQCASLYCGLLVEREDVFDRRAFPGELTRAERFFLSSFLKNCEMGPKELKMPGFKLVNKLREERLQTLLLWEVLESEREWLFFDNEQVEVKLELSCLIFDVLLDETVSEFCLSQ